jgi:DNA-binding response OmpR family regulator
MENIKLLVFKRMSVFVLKEFIQKPVSLVIIDYMMEEISGIRLYKEISAFYK